MPFQITFEHIAGRDNVVSDALSRYPSLKTYAFTLSLISPTSLGVLGRISFVARDDVEYQRLLTKVLEKTNSAGSTGHVVRTVPSSGEPTLENGAKSTALAQPRMLQPELDPGYHMDTRMRPCPEGDPSADLVYQPRPRSAMPLDHRDSGTGDHPSQPRTEVVRPIVAARNTRTRTGNEDSRENRPRTEVDTTNSTPTSQRDDGGRHSGYRRPRITVDRTGRPRHYPENEIQLYQTFPRLPQYQDNEWGIPSSPVEDQPSTGETDSPREELALDDEAARRAIRRYDDPDNLIIENGSLCSPERQILVPQNDELRTWCISQAHDSMLAGHFGVTKTLEKLRRQWIWPGMAQDVREYVATCPLCQSMKHSNVKPRGLLRPILANKPWEVVTMDFVGQFAPDAVHGYTHCLIIVDKFSKFTLLEPVTANVTAEQTADIFLRRVVAIFGIPRLVISDRGPQFTAYVWKSLLQRLGATAAFATSHHPQTDRQSERSIQTFLRLLRSFTSEVADAWAEMLPAFQFALNDSITEGNRYTPHQALFGVNPPSPLQIRSRQDIQTLRDNGRHQAYHYSDMFLHSESDSCRVSPQLTTDEWVGRRIEYFHKIHEFIRKNQELVAQRMKDRYDANRESLDLRPGDLVLISTKVHPKLRPYTKQQEKWAGPYVIRKRVNENAYALVGLPAGMSPTQSASFLTPFRESPEKFQSRPQFEVAIPELRDGEWEWEIDRITDSRQDRHGNYKYLVF